jgi:hypothetical protein
LIIPLAASPVGIKINAGAARIHNHYLSTAIRQLLSVNYYLSIVNLVKGRPQMKKRHPQATLCTLDGNPINSADRFRAPTIYGTSHGQAYI